jgi:hypothetical protein
MSKKPEKFLSPEHIGGLPAGLKARVYQFASRRGKEETEIVRAATLRALQNMVNQGIPLDQIDQAFKGIEADGARNLLYSSGLK